MNIQHMVNLVLDLPPLKEIETLEALRVITDSQRHRILCLLIDESMTATGIAARLKINRTRVYYHLDLLLKHGLIAVVSERQVAAMTERTYSAVAKAFRVNRRVLAASNSEISAVQASVLDHAADDLRHSGDSDPFVSRTFIDLSPDDAAALRAELCELLGKYRKHSIEHNSGYELTISLFDTEAGPS